LIRLPYNLMIALLAAPVLLWKSLRDPAFRATCLGRLGRIPERMPSAPVWLHCASVGEVRAAARLIARLKCEVVVSTMTPTGLALARSLFPGATCMIAPLDLGPLIRRVLRRMAPRMLLIVETELWPELILSAQAHGVPVALVSARISDRTAGTYRRARLLFAPALRAMSMIGAQTETDRDRLVAIGADPRVVEVTGNLKFDLPPAGDSDQILEDLFADAGPLFLAGSTHRGEEVAVLEAWTRAVAVEPALRLVIAPRHLERLPEIDSLLSSKGVRAVRRSALSMALPSDARVILLDTMGELDSLYGFCRVAFVGGSLVPVGGHNVLEPARHGRPVLFGPHMQNFRLEAESLVEAGGALRLPDAEALAVEVSRLLAEPGRATAMGEAARGVLEQNQGSVERTLKLLAPLFEPAEPARGAVHKR
jgi:3-deoxy-D-manno-octulosonic-acid transferase